MFLNDPKLNQKYPASFLLSQTMKVFRLFIADSFSRFEKVYKTTFSGMRPLRQERSKE